MSEISDVAQYFQVKYGIDISDDVTVTEERNELLAGLCVDSYSAALYNGDPFALEAFFFLLGRAADPNSKVESVR